MTVPEKPAAASSAEAQSPAPEAVEPAVAPPASESEPLTDDQIMDRAIVEFGQDQEEQAAAETPTEVSEKESKPDGEEVKPPVEAAEEQPSEDAEEDDLPPTELVDSEDLKAVLKNDAIDPKVRSFMRRTYYRNKAYDELFPGGVKEASELKNFFPGGLPQVQEVVEEAGLLSQFRNAFYDDDAGPQRIAELLYGENEGRYAATAQWFLENGLSGLYQSAQMMKNDEVKEALDEVYRFAMATGMTLRGMNGSRIAQERPSDSQLDPNQRKLQEREQRLKTKEQQWKEREEQGFYDSVNGEVINTTFDEINSTVQKLWPNVEEGAANRMAREVYEEIKRQINSDTTFRKHVSRAIEGGDYSSQHQKQVAQLVIGQYRRLIPTTTAKVVKDWTQTVVKNAQQKNEKQRQLAQKVDLGGGGESQPGPARVPEPTEIDYSRTSDDDLMDGKATLLR